MDPRAALLQQESDESGRFRNKSIGMHNLRAKLREQLKGYSHVRGYPLETEDKRSAAGQDTSRRNDSLSVRRDSIRRRNSSVRQQAQYDAEADSDSERKSKQRRTRKKDSLLIPRLLWFSVYISLCFVAYKGMKYFTADNQVSLCQTCSNGSQCGVLDEEFTIPIDNLGGLPFGTTFPQKAKTQCRAGVCVPSHVADPQALCRVVSDEALLYRTRRLLQNAEGSTEEHNARFLEYFRRRAMREEGMAGALSPDNQPASTVSTDNQPASTVSTDNQPASTVSTDNQPASTVSTDNQPASTVSTDNQPASTVSTDNQPASTTPSTPPGDQGSNQGTDQGVNQGQQGGYQGGQDQSQSQQQQQQQYGTPPPDQSQTGTPPPDQSQTGLPPPMGLPTGAPPPGAGAPSPGVLAPAGDGNLANGAYYNDKSVKWTTLADVAGMASGGGNCSTLKYAPMQGNGYANLTTTYYLGITDVENYQQCCSICSNEPNCAGWTRVAGGDTSVRNCYLKSTLNVDSNPASMAYNWQPDQQVYPPNPEVRYTGGVPIMFESGTRTWTNLPDYVYGCPYPPSADGTCQVPAGCNCGGGVCYPGCTAPPLTTATVSTTSPMIAPSGSATGATVAAPVPSAAM